MISSIILLTLVSLYPNLTNCLTCASPIYNGFSFFAAYVNAYSINKVSFVFASLDDNCIQPFWNVPRCISYSYIKKDSLCTRYSNPYKHIQPITLILAPFSTKEDFNFNLFIHEFILFPATAVLLLLFEGSIPPSSTNPDQISFFSETLSAPGLKAVLHLHAKFPNIRFHCHGYCSQKNLHTNFHINNLLFREHTHRTLFWNANHRNIGAKLRLNFFTFFHQFPEMSSRHNCLSKLHLPLKETFYCDGDLMRIVLLGKLHNISINIFSHEEQHRLNSYLYTSDNQFIDGPWFRTNYTTQPVDTLTSFYFAKYNTVVLAYCKYKRNTQLSPYLIWYLPFCWETWLSVAIFLMIMVLFQRQLQPNSNIIFSIYNVLGDFFGQLGLTEINKHKILLVTCLASFNIQNYYRETITSVIAVSLPPTLHHSVRNILEAGYKIIWYSTPGDYQPPLTDLYLETFKIKGIYDKFNQSFEILNYVELTPYYFARLLLLVNRLGLPIAAFNFGFMKKLIELNVNAIKRWW